MSDPDDILEIHPEDSIISTNDTCDIHSLKDYEKVKQTYETTPVLTKYEKTRVLAERASQIANGSPVFIPKAENYKNVYDIAYRELQLKKIPFIIKRPYGNGYEFWKLEDLIL